MEASVSADLVAVLVERFGALESAGAGAWSTAFSFHRDGRDLIVRVGEHFSDFAVDAEMSSYATTSLPIPEVVELDRLEPPHDRFYVCVSTFAPGEPLETVDSEEWAALVPALVDLLDEMRAISPPVGDVSPRWPAVLLERDESDARMRDWRERLTQRDHVDAFDWGCRRWGDHLYDLAWFEFWAPWHPQLDYERLQSELYGRLNETPEPDRRTTCLLHIGVDHLVYNAVVGDPASGDDVLERMIALDLL